MFIVMLLLHPQSAVWRQRGTWVCCSAPWSMLPEQRQRRRGQDGMQSGHLHAASCMSCPIPLLQWMLSTLSSRCHSAADPAATFCCACCSILAPSWEQWPPRAVPRLSCLLCAACGAVKRSGLPPQPLSRSRQSHAACWPRRWPLTKVRQQLGRTVQHEYDVWQQLSLVDRSKALMSKVTWVAAAALLARQLDRQTSHRPPFGTAGHVCCRRRAAEARQRTGASRCGAAAVGPLSAHRRAIAAAAGTAAACRHGCSGACVVHGHSDTALPYLPVVCRPAEQDVCSATEHVPATAAAPAAARTAANPAASPVASAIAAGGGSYSTSLCAANRPCRTAERGAAAGASHHPPAAGVRRISSAGNMNHVTVRACRRCAACGLQDAAHFAHDRRHEADVLSPSCLRVQHDVTTNPAGSLPSCA